MHTMLSRDTREVHSLFIAGDYQRSYEAGRYDITRIIAVDETGMGAYVAWFEVWKGELLFARINSAFISEVFYREGQ